MFYGPTVGGLITQHLNFKWAAAIQGSLAFLGVSISCVHTIMDVRQEHVRVLSKDDREKKDPN